jgi:predicted TIM-barrel fold metal-dependent hydrolase
VEHESVPACLGCLSASGGILSSPLPALDDEEGPRIADDLPAVVDAHVHLFPDRVFEAIWAWFDEHGWPVRYKLRADAVVEFLASRGVERMVGLAYAHKPGMARALNRFMAELGARHPRVLPLGTVLPGEPGAGDVVEEALDLGLGGVKLHCHVQCFAVDAPALDEVYEVCASKDRPVVVHAGREPKSPAYACDPYEICAAERVGRVLARHPRLRLVVPHLGADEFSAYAALLRKHDGLYLDSTMMIAGYFAGEDPAWMLEAHDERVLYGTDFPNLPYAWDRELRRMASMALKDPQLERVLNGNARTVYGLQVG